MYPFPYAHFEPCKIDQDVREVEVHVAIGGLYVNGKRRLQTLLTLVFKRPAPPVLVFVAFYTLALVAPVVVDAVSLCVTQVRAIRALISVFATCDANKLQGRNERGFGSQKEPKRAKEAKEWQKDGKKVVSDPPRRPFWAKNRQDTTCRRGCTGCPNRLMTWARLSCLCQKSRHILYRGCRCR